MKKKVIEINSIDLGKVVELVKTFIEARENGIKLLISAPKKIALSLAFIGVDSFIDVITK
jgi:hypothetical protein